MEQNLAIESVMTKKPYTIESALPLCKATEMMREHGIRHLPVMHGAKIVGVISDRDIKFAGNFPGVRDMSVDDVMTPNPFTVTPRAKLGFVVSEMAKKKIGC